MALSARVCTLALMYTNSIVDVRLTAIIYGIKLCIKSNFLVYMVTMNYCVNHKTF